MRGNVGRRKFNTSAIDDESRGDGTRAAADIMSAPPKKAGRLGRPDATRSF